MIGFMYVGWFPFNLPLRSRACQYFSLLVYVLPFFMTIVISFLLFAWRWPPLLFLVKNYYRDTSRFIFTILLVMVYDTKRRWSGLKHGWSVQHVHIVRPTRHEIYMQNLHGPEYTLELTCNARAAARRDHGYLSTRLILST
jgi:hypothetical protein